MDGHPYESDFFTWTQRQAAALRRLSARGNTGLDLENLIEEVEGLGRSEVERVERALFRLMEHAALLALAPPDHRDARHWRGEMVGFRCNAARAFRASMRRQVEPGMEPLWRAAREAAARKLGRDPAELPGACPFTIPELLADLPLDDLPRRTTDRASGG